MEADKVESVKGDLVMESYGVPEDDAVGRDSSEYVPFVVGTSIVASGVVTLALVNPEVQPSAKNTVKLSQPKEGTGGILKVVYNFRGEGNAVLIPSIPSILTPADFLAFIRDASGIVDVRLVREASPGMYMALLRFHSARHARRFAETISGRPFSPLEPELCQVLWVAEIEFVTSVSSIVPLFDPDDFKETLQEVLPTEQLPFDSIEVPSCPVCLERLDSSVTGIITTICSHSYHCECMLKWYDGSCPVCRFLLSEEDSEDGSRCVECGCKENLWACLICGNIGCGRYRSRHAQAHFEATGHTFSLELESQRVWDYVGDNYVHRLVHNQDDGKLVEISHPGSPEPTFIEATGKKNEDPDYISSLLVAQLESQRVFYEEKLNVLEASWSTQARAAEAESAHRLDELETSMRSLSIDHSAEFKRMEEHIRSLESRIEVLKQEKAVLQAALAGESAMLEQVMKSQSALEDVIKAKDAEIVELQEQITDLFLHIEGQKAIEASSLSHDLKSGSITLVETAPPNNQPAHKKHTARRKN